MKKNKQKKFSDKVLDEVAKIKKGEVQSYKQIAKKSGNSSAQRAVGNILNKNRNPKVPCHRVIRSDGKVGGFNAGKNKKIEILKKEGIKIKDGKIVLN